MYNSFDKEPKIKVDPNNINKPFTLLNNIYYLSSKFYDSESYCISINKGYNWDGATIPKFLWLFIGSRYNPEFLPASMIHDWLMEHKRFIQNDGILKSSLIFRDILLLYKVHKLKANIMAIAVYLFQLTQKDWK